MNIICNGEHDSCVQVLRWYGAYRWARKTLSEESTGGLQSGLGEMGCQRSAILGYQIWMHLNLSLTTPVGMQHLPCSCHLLSYRLCFSVRVTCKLRRLHGCCGAPRQDHGAGSSRWRSPDARLHDWEEKNLGNLNLLWVHAIQGMYAHVWSGTKRLCRSC